MLLVQNVVLPANYEMLLVRFLAREDRPFGIGPTCGVSCASTPRRHGGRLIRIRGAARVCTFDVLWQPGNVRPQKGSGVLG